MSPLQPFSSRVLSPVLVVLALLALASSASAEGGNIERPANVYDEAHSWLSENLDAAMPFLVQSEYGPIDDDHIYIVSELGEWAAGRRRGKHQGNDFVLDLPHKDDKQQLWVGSILPGVVVHAPPAWGAYGNTVFVYSDVGPKLMFIYAHLDTMDVAVGDELETGTLLGRFGCTGNCRGLRGSHIRHQVHVEVYSLPDDFSPEAINWDERPVGQLRDLARHQKGEAHGVDIRAYFDKFEVGDITRGKLALRYEKNQEGGALAKHLSQLQKRAAEAAQADRDLDQELSAMMETSEDPGDAAGQHDHHHNERDFAEHEGHDHGANSQEMAEYPRADADRSHASRVEAALVLVDSHQRGAGGPSRTTHTHPLAQPRPTDSAPGVDSAPTALVAAPAKVSDDVLELPDTLGGAHVMGSESAPSAGDAPPSAGHTAPSTSNSIVVAKPASETSLGRRDEQEAPSRVEPEKEEVAPQHQAAGRGLEADALDAIAAAEAALGDSPFDDDKPAAGQKEEEEKSRVATKVLGGLQKLEE